MKPLNFSHLIFSAPRGTFQGVKQHIHFIHNHLAPGWSPTAKFYGEKMKRIAGEKSVVIIVHSLINEEFKSLHVYHHLALKKRFDQT